MGKYFARKTPCQHGHNHASAKEAKRCNELHLRERAGEIENLEVEPIFKFVVNGQHLKMGNGQAAQYRPDFIYTENGREVAEDVKGVIVRDFPLRAALFRVCWPTIELRVVK